MLYPKGFKEFMGDLEEYKDLDEEARVYIERFYREYYNDGVSFKTKILNSPDMIKEARRNHNSVKTDMYTYASKTGKLDSLANKVQASTINRDEFWQGLYKAGGYSVAARGIVAKVSDAIDRADTPIEEELVNLIVFMRKLDKYHRQCKRKNKG